MACYYGDEPRQGRGYGRFDRPYHERGDMYSRPNFYQHPAVQAHVPRFPQAAHEPRYFPNNYRRDQPAYSLEGFQRDYRRGSSSWSDRMGRHGVVPLQEGFRAGEYAPHWMGNGRGYHQGRQYSGGYRVDRHDHHGAGQGLRGYGIDIPHHQEDMSWARDNYVGHHGLRLSPMAVELYVPICCDKCERKLRKHLDYVEGVENITMDQATKKVVVFGNVNPQHVLNRARVDKPESQFWH